MTQSVSSGGDESSLLFSKTVARPVFLFLVCFGLGLLLLMLLLLWGGIPEIIPGVVEEEE